MKEEERFNIAIDGPAGAGKSTIARRVAKELGYVYVDTGAMYRAMALYMLRQGQTAEGVRKDPQTFAQFAAAHCAEPSVSLTYQDGEQVVLLNGENVNGLIRTEEVSGMASLVSAVPEVRVRMVALQQALGRQENVVMDGRDIGTVVLPDAQVKVFLTASPAVRARRRYLENVEKKKAGKKIAAADLDLKKIEEDMVRRDHDDMTRAASPLKKAEDAIEVDSSGLTIDQVVEKILNLVAVKKNDRR